jgi:hypothetical protein
LPTEEIKLLIPIPPGWEAEDAGAPAISFIVVPFSNADLNSNITLTIREVRAEVVTA